jgi:putative heme-binding domain-containing protein
VRSASVTPDRQTLILTTDRHRAAVAYAISLPGLGRESVTLAESDLPQHPLVELEYSLSGILAHWKSADGSIPDWSGWLSHCDFEHASKLHPTLPQLSHFRDRLAAPGILTLNYQLDPRGLFFPAIQPGSTLDYSPQDDSFITQTHFQLTGTQPFNCGDSETTLKEAISIDGQFVHSIEIPLNSSALIPITLQLKTGTNTPTIRGEWNAQLQNGKSRSGPIAVHRFLLPWAEPNIPGSESTATESIPQLADADWGRGRRVFLDPQVGCSKCHLSHGIGGTIGPDLSNLVHRDYDSVLRDVKNPGFSINPDYITYNVRLKDSRVLAGALRNEGSTYRITDQNAQTTTFSEDEIDELKPTTVSIMPEGIVEKLDKKSLNDLLAYLLLKPPHMPIEKDVARPKLRTRAEVESALASSDLASTATTEGASQRASKRPLRILLVAGKKDHGPGEHDYPAWLRMWSQLMSAAEEVSVSTAMEWPTEEQLNVADTIVFFQRGKWNLERSNAIDALLQKGIGLVYIHWAIEGGIDASLFAERIGLAGYAKETRYRHGPLKLDFRVGSKHPIARNFEALDLVDESYWKLRGDPSKIDTIGTATEEGSVCPLFWTMEPGPGRVFVSVPGHYSWTFDDPMFRILLLRGIAWSARESVDRFNDLVLLGVPIQN